MCRKRKPNTLPHPYTRHASVHTKELINASAKFWNIVKSVKLVVELGLNCANLTSLKLQNLSARFKLGTFRSWRENCPTEPHFHL